VTSRPALSHDDIQELLGAHATDAVDVVEGHELEDHLDLCETCRREVRSHHESLAALVTPERPPSGLRPHVLDAVEPRRG